MLRTFRPLLLLVALLFSQHAAMLHGLEHAEHDLTLSTHQDGQAPALGHSADVCAAFGALAHALGNAGTTPSGAAHTLDGFFRQFQNAAAVTRIGFDSRAPPLSA
jgi:hypothetical protein